MKHQYTTLFAALFIAAGAQAQSLLSAGFDDVTSMLSNGWSVQNNSAPLGTTQWAQGNGQDIGVAEGHAGGLTSYAWDTFSATDEDGTGTISDWLISPQVTLQNGDSIAIWTVSYNAVVYADRLEIRISPNGGSDVGTSETSVGDFTVLVLAINPDLTVGGYPSTENGDTWTRYAAAVTGLTGSASCRVAFRYFIEDGGGFGANGSSIGIDSFDAFRGESTASVDERSIPSGSTALMRSVGKAPPRWMSVPSLRCP